MMAKGPWFGVKEAAQYAKCGQQTIYRAVRAKRLRAAPIDGRRSLRMCPEWIDEWISGQREGIALPACDDPPEACDLQSDEHVFHFGECSCRCGAISGGIG